MRECGLARFRIVAICLGHMTGSCIARGEVAEAQGRQYVLDDIADPIMPAIGASAPLTSKPASGGEIPSTPQTAMADSIKVVQGFQALGDAERQATLEQLVQCLNIDERAELSTLLSRRNDFTYRLSTELVQLVFDFVPLLQVWTLQSVSRQWRDILSRPQFLKARLAQESRLTTADLDTEDLIDDDADVRRSVRHMQATTLIRPFTYHDMMLSMNNPSLQTLTSNINRVLLHDHHLAHINDSPVTGSEVIVRNLITGVRRSFRSESRQKIMCLTLTDRLIAFATFDAKLYVRPLDAPDAIMPKRVLLPSANIQAIHSHDDMVAVLMPNRDAGSATILVGSVIFRDFFEHKISYGGVTAISGNDRMKACNVLVNSNDRHVDVFSCNADSSAELMPKIMHSRFRLPTDGKSGVTLVPSMSTIVDLEQRAKFGIGEIMHIGIRQLFRVSLRSFDYHGSPSAPGNEYAQGLSIIFDAQTARMYIEHHPIHYPIRPSADRALKCRIVRWKDSLYCITDANTVAFRRDLARGEERYLFEGAIVKAQDGEDHALIASFMNGDYLVQVAIAPGSANLYRIRVFCFNEERELHGGHETGLWKGSNCKHDTLSSERFGESVIQTFDELKNMVPFSYHAPYRRTLPYQSEEDEELP
jgi:hypothetical protein